MVSVQTQHMTQSQKKVLRYLAEKGPATKYEIEKITKVNHASVHEAIKKFLGYQFIEGETIGITRVRLPKIQYRLNFHGLLAALRIADWKDIGKIVQKWTHLEPLLLGKWKYLIEKLGRRGEVEMFLQRGAAIIHRYHHDEEIIEEFREEAVRRLFDYFRVQLPTTTAEFEHDFKREFGHTFEESFKKWLEAFREDPQLKKLATKYITETLKSANEDRKWAHFLKRKILQKSTKSQVSKV